MRQYSINNLHQWDRNGITLQIASEGDADARYWVVTADGTRIVATSRDDGQARAKANEWADAQITPVITPVTPNWENTDLAQLAGRIMGM